MDLFIYFALPFAVILLSIVLQKILRCPILVSITIFAIGLIVAFAVYSSVLQYALIAIIIYTIISFVTAFLVMVFNSILKRLHLNPCELNNERTNLNNFLDATNFDDSNNDTISNLNGRPRSNLLSISCNCPNGSNKELLTVNSNCLGSNSMRNDDENNSNCGCGCGCQCTDSEFEPRNIAVSARVTPSIETRGRTGWVRGCYRRR